MTPNRFRLLLSLAIALALIGGLVDLVFPQLLSPAFVAAQAQHDENQPDWLILGAALPILAFLAGSIWATVGLFRLRAWARRWSLILTLAALPITFITGPMVQSGPALLLTELSLMLWGSIIALAYYSELAEHFADQAR